MENLTFEEWMKQVDAAVAKRCGLSAQDLPDVDYHGLYRTGDSPDEAARYAIRNAADLDTDGGDDGDYEDMLR
jgi:hypothetical protein